MLSTDHKFSEKSVDRKSLEQLNFYVVVYLFKYTEKRHSWTLFPLMPESVVLIFFWKAMVGVQGGHGFPLRVLMVSALGMVDDCCCWRNNV